MATTTNSLSKVRVPSVAMRESTLEHLKVLAEGIGKNSAAAVLSELAEAASRVKAENFHVALAEFIKHGSK